MFWLRQHTLFGRCPQLGDRSIFLFLDTFSWTRKADRFSLPSLYIESTFFHETPMIAFLSEKLEIGRQFGSQLAQKINYTNSKIFFIFFKLSWLNLDSFNLIKTCLFGEKQLHKLRPFSYPQICSEIIFTLAQFPHTYPPTHCSFAHTVPIFLSSYSCLLAYLKLCPSTTSSCLAIGQIQSSI